MEKRRSSGRVSLLAQLPRYDNANESKRIKLKETEIIRLVENACDKITTKSKLWEDVLKEYEALEDLHLQSDVYSDKFDACIHLFGDEQPNQISRHIHKLNLTENDINLSSVVSDKNIPSITNVDTSLAKNNTLCKEKIVNQAAQDIEREIPTLKLSSTEMQAPFKLAANQLACIKNEITQLDEYIEFEKNRLLADKTKQLRLLFKDYFYTKRQLSVKNL